jgi:hypothetical protein
MRIVESYPGEFDDLSHEEVHEKIEKAVAMVTGKPRGGELQLMVDLSRSMSDSYRERMNKMMEDFAELEEAGELEPWGDEPEDWAHQPDIPEAAQPLATEELHKAMSKAEAEMTQNLRDKYLGDLEGEERRERAEEIMHRKEHRSNKPFETDEGKKTKPSKHSEKFEDKYGRAPSSVSDAAKLSGVSKEILDEVYDRGMAAWQTGHRPGASQHAWAMARVQSFLTGGPTSKTADSDLASKAGLRKAVEEDEDDDLLTHEDLRKALTEFFFLPEEIDEFLVTMESDIAKGISDSETFTPPEGAASAARRGLKLRESLPPSRRGGTAVGITRAHQLANREAISFSTVKRMYSFFARHSVDKSGEGWGKDSKGWQAWLLWGGDAGKTWADGIVARHKKSED